MAYLIDYNRNELLGEIGIRSKHIPRIDETIVVDDQPYRVMDVIYRNSIVRYEREYRVDIYVIACSAWPEIKIPGWDGIDEERWVVIRKQYAKLEAAEEKEKKK